MSLKIDTVVDESQDYVLIVVSGEDGTGEYALRNKLYGVDEARTPLLPQGLEYLEQLQAGLDARRDIAEDNEDRANSIAAAAINKAAKSGGLH